MRTRPVKEKVSLCVRPQQLGELQSWERIRRAKSYATALHEICPNEDEDGEKEGDDLAFSAFFYFLFHSNELY